MGVCCSNTYVMIGLSQATNSVLYASLPEIKVDGHNILPHNGEQYNGEIVLLAGRSFAGPQFVAIVGSEHGAMAETSSAEQQANEKVGMETMAALDRKDG